MSEYIETENIAVRVNMRTLIIALQSLDKENLGITTMEILIETIKKSFSVAFNFVCGAKIL